jgi:hypothetical protein
MVVSFSLNLGVFFREPFASSRTSFSLPVIGPVRPPSDSPPPSAAGVQREVGKKGVPTIQCSAGDSPAFT